MSKFWADLAERSLSTFAQGFVGAVTIDAALTDINLSLLHKVEMAAVVGGYAVVKGIAAKGFGAPDSASLLPADVDPPQPEDAPAVPAPEPVIEPTVVRKRRRRAGAGPVD